MVDKLAVELPQVRSEHEGSAEALRLEKEAKKRMNKAVSNLLAPPPTSPSSYERAWQWEAAVSEQLIKNPSFE